MSVRVVARIRPLLKSELDKDVILEASSTALDSSDRPNTIVIPNPKNESKENYRFQFNSVYEQEASQQEVFDGEISPTVKHLFGGFDVTIFAYGVTGSGKTHTMRGGKTLAERGVIPRLLSSIYRKGRKIEKDTDGETRVEVTMSYYEIYNDRVFDLFEPPEKRTLAGLPLRDNGGKTVVAGLTERPCTTLRDFEQLYDQANVNRSTSATKLNAHSSRSHAVLCVKVSQISAERTITSTASAIDLAGSEDNRRTDNDKERLVESSSINKSLFVLAQCVEAISKKQARIPYRESKMTRILSLGQNNGLTVMILNLAPIRSYHLDTLSSLNFANRTKKVEVREIENEPIFKGKTGIKPITMALSAPSADRQPLRAIPANTNSGLKSIAAPRDKPAKTFSVFSESNRSSGGQDVRKDHGVKRAFDHTQASSVRPAKSIRPSDMSKLYRSKESELSRANIEQLVNRMVDEKLAKQALNDTVKLEAPALSDDVKRRLEALEQRVERKEDGRTEGLQYLLMAKQHQVRGEDSSALKMFQLALPYFPDNEKLAQKMLALQDKISAKRDGHSRNSSQEVPPPARPQHLALQPLRPHVAKPAATYNDDDEDEYVAAEDEAYDTDASTAPKPRRKPAPARKLKVFCEPLPSASAPGAPPTPRTTRLLDIINTRDLAQIRSLKGVGAKKAETIVSCLCEMDDAEDGALVTDLEQLGGLRGVSSKLVETMRSAIAV